MQAPDARARSPEVARLANACGARPAAAVTPVVPGAEPDAATGTRIAPEARSAGNAPEAEE